VAIVFNLFRAAAIVALTVALFSMGGVAAAAVGIAVAVTIAFTIALVGAAAFTLVVVWILPRARRSAPRRPSASWRVV
jgi:membrane protein implicated in regulation of membrane protease activity